LTICRRRFRPLRPARDRWGDRCRGGDRGRGEGIQGGPEEVDCGAEGVTWVRRTFLFTSGCWPDLTP